jgi:hypothetical protein
MYAEALFWLGVILASPAIVMLSKMFVTWILDLFISDETVVITLKDDDGNIVEKTVHLDRSDELIKLMDEIKLSSRSRDNKGASF